ncbi:hypothetical protein [Chengkuizengella axinellae]|uniref:Uncharacterized protein n=1 Tax=Chengkuizengella axinellae TaxID=3064388 RepID=A0ABT9J3J1_9BACL|nr:hypothetical protein [Chengkuizengella sp. 2205SS18-9]MDP5276187.1 hypothetical protein [Chengkuizengella sp. 2205SS18-9]
MWIRKMWMRIIWTFKIWHYKLKRMSKEEQDEWIKREMKKLGFKPIEEKTT